MESSPAFVIPVHPPDLQLPVRDRYCVEKPVRIDALSEAALTKLVDGTNFATLRFPEYIAYVFKIEVSARLRRNGARSIVDHANFDVLFSTLKYGLFSKNFTATESKHNFASSKHGLLRIVCARIPTHCGSHRS